MAGAGRLLISHDARARVFRQEREVAGCVGHSAARSRGPMSPARTLRLIAPLNFRWIDVVHVLVQIRSQCEVSAGLIICEIEAPDALKRIAVTLERQNALQSNMMPKQYQ